MAADVEMDNRFQVFVRCVAGRQYRTFTLDVSGNDRICDVAAQLENKTSVCQSQIMLAYRSKPLKADRLLSDYNIQRESTLSASVRPQSNGNVDHGNSSFPVTIKNEQLMNAISAIDSKIASLRADFKRRISSEITGINGLRTFWGTIGGEFNDRYRQLNAEKVKLYNEIMDNHERQSNIVGVETDTVRTEISSIDATINETDRRISRMKQEISRMTAEIKVLETKKVEQSKKRGIKQRELGQRLESIESIHAERHQTNVVVASLRMEMQKESLRPEFEEALKECEKDIGDWTTVEVLEWIKNIENGKFNDEERYRKLFDAVRRLQLDGESFPDLRNEPCLKLCDLNKMEIKTIFKNIDRVLKQEGDGQSNKCTVCVNTVIDCVFTPCGHQVVCWQCYKQQKSRFERCPICRKGVAKTVRTFMNGF